jgi:hypothetical protein
MKGCLSSWRINPLPNWDLLFATGLRSRVGDFPQRSRVTSRDSFFGQSLSVNHRSASLMIGRRAPAGIRYTSVFLSGLECPPPGDQRGRAELTIFIQLRLKRGFPLAGRGCGKSVSLSVDKEKNGSC